MAAFNGISGNGRGDLRRRVLRYARSHPEAAVAQIAVRAGCHPSTAAKHLRSCRPARVRAPRQLIERAEASEDGTELVRLARNHDPMVRRRVATNTSCPPRALERLDRDPSGLVRYWAIQHPDAAPASLARHAAEPAARSEVIEHPNCPGHVLARLARDPVQRIRLTVSKLDTTPTRVLEWLSTQSDIVVAQSAAKTLEIRRRQRDGLL